jgi:predicted dehydrogenase
MWNAFDSPGRLLHLARGTAVLDTAGEASAMAWELGGFYAEYEAFLGDVAEGRTPGPSLEQARQSVVVAEHIRERRSAYKA